MIFTSLARAHEHVHVQNVRDFPQTKLDSEINSPFLLNEHGNPQFFRGGGGGFAQKSLTKKTFEKEKSLIVEHDISWKIAPDWVYFGQGKNL